MQVNVSAHAKLNLTLDITGRRDDGYHFIEMIMQSVDLADTVIVSQVSEPGITVSCNVDELNGAQDNIAYKAAKLYLSENGLLSEGIRIKIKKRIPLCAGLAGGSADAAAVLLALNMMYESMEQRELNALGLTIGSDVPFCMAGGTMLVEGTGGLLSPLPDIPECTFVLVKPEEKLSTSEMYRRYDELKHTRHPKTRTVAEYICEGNLKKLSEYVMNVFDELWDSEKTTHAKRIMLAHDALNVSISGSGPTVFGIFEECAVAEKCAAELKELFQEVYVCRPASIGCKCTVTGE